jgi:hypothetical protein
VRDGAEVSAAFDPLVFNVTSIASVSSQAEPANGRAGEARLSADGRYVVFESAASNLVQGDSNGRTDIFRRDTQTGETIRVSLTSGGAQIADADSNTPTISADGGQVAFRSLSSSVVAGDANGRLDVFERDIDQQTTTRVSVASDGAEGNGHSSTPIRSANGRYVAFQSEASNLVAADTNAASDIFVRDTQANTTTRVSVASDGTQTNAGSVTDRPSISADGRYVAFHSTANNLVASDINNATDVFVKDRQTGTTTRVSVIPASTTGGNNSSTNANLSADGRYVVFQSAATNLVAGDTNNVQGVFRRDTQTATTIRVSVQGVSGAQVNGASGVLNRSISADGRYVVFESAATNLLPFNPQGPFDLNGVTDIFVRDTVAGTTTRASVTAAATDNEVVSASVKPAMSADGRYVAFESAGALTPVQAGNFTGVFLRKIN